MTLTIELNDQYIVGVEALENPHRTAQQPVIRLFVNRTDKDECVFGVYLYGMPQLQRLYKGLDIHRGSEGKIDFGPNQSEVIEVCRPSKGGYFMTLFSSEETVSLISTRPIQIDILLAKLSNIMEAVPINGYY